MVFGPIRFSIPVAPRSLQFAGRRFTARGGRIRSYKTSDATAYLSEIFLLSKPYCPKVPILGAVELTMGFVFARPKSAPKAYLGRIRHSNRPDADNIVKAIQDVLSKAGFWLDDGQVSDLIIRKRYATPREKACIEIQMREVEYDASDEEAISASVGPALQRAAKTHRLPSVVSPFC